MAAVSDEIFTDHTERMRSVDAVVEVIAYTACAVPGENGNEAELGTTPYITLEWPGEPGAGADLYTVAKARRLIAALEQCIAHCERAIAEADRRGWKLAE